jgi:predicted nucleotidyltransferase component of viral defense system
MTGGVVKDLAASIRARLTNRARQTGRPFQEVLTHFTLERFLYRLSRSPHAERFVLKGGLMLRAWAAPQSRPTRDADFLGRGDPSAEELVRVMREVCAVAVEPDGLTFDRDSVRGERTRPNEEYQGIQIHLVGHLGQARTAVKLDVGFGDAVVPAPVELAYPTILDLPAPRLRGYTRESVIAEKFQAMVALGEANSRFKDFYDVWLLAQHFDFDAAVLVTAVRTTFARRGTELPRAPLPLTDTFAQDDRRATQWRAFLRRSVIEEAPSRFSDVVEALRVFLQPVVDAIHAADAPRELGTWRAAGGWTRRVGG